MTSSSESPRRPVDDYRPFMVAIDNAFGLHLPRKQLGMTDDVAGIFRTNE